MPQMSKISTILGRQEPTYSSNLQIIQVKDDDDDSLEEVDCSAEQQQQQQHRHHHFHDVLSVSFFFLGSVVGLILSIWDLTSIWDDGDDDDWLAPSLLETNLLEWDSYDYLAASVPSLYLLSSMTHIRSSLVSGEQHSSLRDLLPYLSFGLGSILELTAAFIDSDEDETAGRASHVVSVTSNLLYLVFSIHMLLSPLNAADFMLETVGSISVLLGTLVDTITSMFVLVVGDVESITLYAWYLVSAGLWFLCAGLYILANIKERKRATMGVK